MDNIKRKEQGLPYRYDDPALLGDQHIYQDKMIAYNLTLATETEKRQRLLKEVFAEVGEGCTVETPCRIYDVRASGFADSSGKSLCL